MTTIQYFDEMQERTFNQIQEIKPVSSFDENYLALLKEFYQKITDLKMNEMYDEASK